VKTTPNDGQFAELFVERAQDTILFVSAGEGGLLRVTGRKHAQDVFHGKPPSPDDRLARESLWIDNNASEQFAFIHDVTLCFACRFSIYSEALSAAKRSTAGPGAGHPLEPTVGFCAAPAAAHDSGPRRARSGAVSARRCRRGGGYYGRRQPRGRMSGQGSGRAANRTNTPHFPALVPKSPST